MVSGSTKEEPKKRCWCVDVVYLKKSIDSGISASIHVTPHCACPAVTEERTNEAVLSVALVILRHSTLLLTDLSELCGRKLALVGSDPSA